MQNLFMPASRSLVRLPASWSPIPLPASRSRVPLAANRSPIPLPASRSPVVTDVPLFPNSYLFWIRVTNSIHTSELRYSCCYCIRI